MAAVDAHAHVIVPSTLREVRRFLCDGVVHDGRLVRALVAAVGADRVLNAGRELRRAPVGGGHRD